MFSRLDPVNNSPPLLSLNVGRNFVVFAIVVWDLK